MLALPKRKSRSDREKYKVKSFRYNSTLSILILLNPCFAVLRVLHFQKNQDTNLEYFYIKIKRESLAAFPRSEAYKYSEAMCF